MAHWLPTFCFLDVLVKAKGNMYILGENFTAADIIVGHCLRWSKAYGLCDNEVNCAKLGLSFAFEMFTAGGTTLDRIFMQTQGGSKTTNFNSTRFQSSTKKLDQQVQAFVPLSHHVGFPKLCWLLTAFRRTTLAWSPAGSDQIFGPPCGEAWGE